MASISSLRLDPLGLPLEEQTEYQIMWGTGDEERLTIQFFLVATELEADLTDPAGIRQYFESMIQAQRGAVVSQEVRLIQGLEATRTILKLRYPAPGDMRFVYLGSWMIPFADFSYTIRIQCIETGMTGVREAAVAVLQPASEQHAPSAEPIMVQSVEELFERMHQAPVRVGPSDDEQYDEMFPDHPLSKVRRYLKHIEQTLEVDAELRKARPYRKAAQ